MGSDKARVFSLKEFADRHGFNRGTVRMVVSRYWYRSDGLPYGEKTVAILLALDEELRKAAYPGKKDGWKR